MTFDINSIMRQIINPNTEAGIRTGGLKRGYMSFMNILTSLAARTE
ncbi:MAG TPA: hypothetical protein VEH06_15820 [Candidatus Bathyarchaeia archaeon]|nr:hypothetical protein [Candidatus Bathyarchaeia archaeon]